MTLLNLTKKLSPLGKKIFITRQSWRFGYVVFHRGIFRDLHERESYPFSAEDIIANDWKVWGRKEE